MENNRIRAKGLLFNDLDNLWQETIESLYKKSKMSRDDFASSLKEKEDSVNNAFDDVMLKEHKKSYTLNFSKYHKNILKVQQAIGKIYEEPFQFFFSYLSTCHVILNNLFKQINHDAINETDVVVTSLYSHLLRKADQIGIMLLNGYDDASLIIWRAFYEYAITLKVLADQNNEQLTRKFIRHQVQRSKRLMESYNKRLVSEGFDPVAEEDIKLTNAEMEQLTAEFGKGFTDGEYGWADGIPGLKGRPTLINLEELSEIGRYRPFYIFASGYTHANFAVFNNVNEDGIMRIERIKEVQPKLEDFVDPMQITLAVLEDVNASYLKLISDDDEAGINADLLNSLYMQLIEFFQLNTTEDDTNEKSKI